MGDFAGLNIGLSALHAARTGLDTTGHNIANANTEGYSRQRVDLQGVGGNVVPSFFSKTNGVGQGVIAGDISRLRDAFLENRAQTEHANASQLDEAQSALGQIEQAFGEPGDSGIQAQLSAMWSSWDEVANRPGDLASRNQVLEQAQTLVTGIRQAASDLDSLQAADVERLKGTISDVNATAQRVAELNGAIRDGVNAGASPNDLMDQRDLLVQKLATLVGATSRPGASGVVDVYVNGTALVREQATTTLAVTAPTATTAAVVWQPGGVDAGVGQGTVGGVLTAVNTTIPTYRSGLNGIAAQLATTANTLHQAGFDLSGTAGVAFFTTTPGNEAGSIAVNAALIGNPQLLAASSTAAGDLDGSAAQALAEAGTATGAPDPSYRQLIDQLGVQAQAANRRVDVQTRITDAIDASRESESGVNLDEEMTQMLAYQRGYEAAAKFVSTVDQTLQTLIGMVA